MKTIKLSVALLIVLMFFAVPCIASSPVNDPLDQMIREPLHGIKRICLLDISAERDVIKDGLDVDAIKISIENKMRIAGLKIEPVSSMWEPFTTRPQSISVTIDSLKIKDQPIYCYDVRFEVVNYVVLVQDKRVSQGFTVWEQHTLGYAGTSRLSTIKDTCDNFTDKFVNDWLKAKDETPGVYPKSP